LDGQERDYNWYVAVAWAIALEDAVDDGLAGHPDNRSRQVKIQSITAGAPTKRQGNKQAVRLCMLRIRHGRGARTPARRVINRGVVQFGRQVFQDQKECAVEVAKLEILSTGLCRSGCTSFHNSPRALLL
jgi:hypothetical protein